MGKYNGVEDHAMLAYETVLENIPIHHSVNDLGPDGYRHSDRRIGSTSLGHLAPPRF